CRGHIAGARPAADRRSRLGAGSPVHRPASVAGPPRRRANRVPVSAALCILAGGKATAPATAIFTLSWTHSVQKLRWEEDWRVAPAGLEIVEARIKGSGAGMEPAEDAVLRNGWWTYRPTVPPRQEILLAASGATTSGWTLCTPNTCLDLGASAGTPIRL